jgi:ligand-binding sensor domain-containing protein/signal transduction histidine kinase
MIARTPTRHGTYLSPALFYLILFCLFSAPAAFSQYRFEVLKTENGLPQNSVYSILQTRDGYLWITTLDGLVRYNGAEFKVFNKANSKALRSNRLTRLFEDSEGRLWICTEDGGLTQYDNGKFTTYTASEGLPDNWVYNLRQTNTGDILIQTHSGLLARHRNGQIDIVPTNSNPFVHVLGYQGRSGATWYRLGTALRQIKNGETTNYTVPEYSPDDQHYPQLYEDRQGRLWIGTKRSGLLTLKDGQLTRYLPGAELPAATITPFCEDREGTIWFGTDGSGLVSFKDGKFTTFTTRDGLPTDRISTVYEDREGTLWIGTNGSGLVRVEKQIIKAYSEKEGLANTSFYPLWEDRAGNIWMGSLGIYRLKDGTFSYYPLNISPEAKRTGLRNKSATALYEDDDGRLWIGSDRDLFSFKDEKFNVETGLGDNIFGTSLTCVIHKDRSGSMWFGTFNGLIKYRAGELRRYTTDDGLPGNEVHAICEDTEGNLWIGTYGGLARLSNEQFTSYTEDHGLSSNRIRSIYQDKHGTLWIGTYDGGLSRFKDGRFTRYTTSEGLLSNGVFQILEDDSGNFWMSSNQGIYRVSRQQLDDFAEGKITSLNVISYGVRDGMRNAECNGGQQPAGIKTRNGQLWFPTIEGVVVVDSKAVTFNSEPPPVVIENVLLNRKELSSSEAVTIYPGEQNLEIRYAALSFIKPEQVNFRYKIEGLEGDWIEAGSRRTAFFSHLPAGEYIFKVIAANSDGVWNQEGATIRIIVVPPFWQTMWFAALMILTLAIATALVFRIRIQKVERARLAQEAFSRQLIFSQEAERKRIAAELHDSLGQNLLVIKNWAMMAKQLLEPGSRASEPLNEIALAASDSIEEAREIAYNLRPYHLDEIGLTEAIHSMIEKVADSSGIRFKVEVDSIDELFSAESEINLYRVIQESINNIVKHSGADEAEVLITRDARTVSIVIKDPGKGFETESALNKKDHGFGLTGIGERVRLLGGKHLIQSAAGKGTTINITLDLQKISGDGQNTNSDS